MNQTRFIGVLSRRPGRRRHVWSCHVGRGRVLVGRCDANLRGAAVRAKRGTVVDRSLTLVAEVIHESEGTVSSFKFQVSRNSNLVTLAARNSANHLGSNCFHDLGDHHSDVAARITTLPLESDVDYSEPSLPCIWTNAVPKRVPEPSEWIPTTRWLLRVPTLIYQPSPFDP